MDWKTLLVGVIIGALVSIPVGFFINIATPWVKSYIENRSLTTKQRRIKITVQDYKHIKANIIQHEFGMYELFQDMIIIGGGFIMSLAYLGMAAFIYYSTVDPSLFGKILFVVFVVLAIVNYLISIAFINYGLDTTRKILRFGKFREKTIAKLIKLGGNPEDLDREEETNKPIEESKPLKRNKNKVG